MIVVVALSLVDGWLPPALLGAAGASSAVVVWTTRRVPAQLVRPAVVAAAVTAFMVVVLGLVDPLQFRLPTAFYGWSAVAVFTVTLALTSWRQAANRQRAVAVVAALATTLGLASLVNTHYAYYPTLAALRGEVSPYRVDHAQLAVIRDQVAVTGRLPPSGAVVELDIPATASGFDARPALVYVPPTWFTADPPTLPVLVLIPGTPSAPGDWFRAGGADRVADAYAAGHDGFAPILVVPDVNGSTFGDTECVDGPRGAAETYVTVDVTAAVVDVLGASPDPHRWGLVGLSAGGTCALTLALRHPDRYAVFADFSGDATPNLGSRRRTIEVLYGGDASQWEAHDPAALLAAGSFDGMRARFEVGRHDHGPRRAAESLAAAAEQSCIDTTLVVREGGHSYRFWRRAFSDSFDWLVESLSQPTVR